MEAQGGGQGAGTGWPSQVILLPESQEQIEFDFHGI